MSVNVKRALARFLIFGMIGLLLEVFFVAVCAAKDGNWNLHGQSSPWMIFDYGLLGLVLMPIARPLIRRGIPLALRAIVYMLGVFTIEFVSGWLFHLAGLKIWDYSHLPYNLFGYISALYIPLWYAMGLAAEYVYGRVDAIAIVLVRGLTAERLEGPFPRP